MFALLTEVVFRNLVNKLTIKAYRSIRGGHDLDDSLKGVTTESDHVPGYEYH